MRTGVLGQRDVRLIGGAVGLSALGDFLLWVPLTLHLHAMTGSGVAVAALFVALWAPIVVLAPVAGLLVDRLEARALLLVASLAQAALALALGSVAAILVLATLLGVGFAVAQAAEFALLPQIAGAQKGRPGPGGRRRSTRRSRRPGSGPRASRARPRRRNYQNRDAGGRQGTGLLSDFLTGRDPVARQVLEEPMEQPASTSSHMEP
jgi:hypothetical protein